MRRTPLAPAELLTAVFCLVVFLACGGSTRAAMRIATLDPAASRVTFTLDATAHVVDGTMQLLDGEIRFDMKTGAAMGEVRIDARSGATGNAKRDGKMHEKVLESGAFPLILFRPRRIEGPVAESGRSEVRVLGEIVIHGDSHPVTLPATLELSGGRFTADLTFDVPFVEWGMQDPSFLFLRVAKEVRVTVAAGGSLNAPTDPLSP